MSGADPINLTTQGLGNGTASREIFNFFQEG